MPALTTEGVLCSLLSIEAMKIISAGALGALFFSTTEHTPEADPDARHVLMRQLQARVEGKICNKQDNNMK